MTRSYPLPSIDREQMIEVDRLMINEYQISLIQMMEHAGENLARLASWKVQELDAPQIMVLCGNGHNGGGGLVCARFLINWGYAVKVILVGEESRRKPVPEQHVQTLHQMGADIVAAEMTGFTQIIDGSDLIIDAMIGYGLSGKLSPRLTEIIKSVNNSKVPVVALDAPSGLDVSGEVQGESIQADATMTLALPKQGLMLAENAAHVGQLFLADIGVPTQLYSKLGLEVENPFINSSIVQLTDKGQFESIRF